MRQIQLPNEYFQRTHIKTKGRRDYPCYVCGKIIPKGTDAFVIYLHPGRAKACDNCVKIVE